MRAHVGELGDSGGEGHADGRGQMAHEILEELLARAAGGPLDDGTEEIEVVIVGRPNDPFPPATRGLAPRESGR